MRSQQIIDRKFANFVHVWYGGTCMHIVLHVDTNIFKHVIIVLRGLNLPYSYFQSIFIATI